MQTGVADHANHSLLLLQGKVSHRVFTCVTLVYIQGAAMNIVSVIVSSCSLMTKYFNLFHHLASYQFYVSCMVWYVLICLNNEVERDQHAPPYPGGEQLTLPKIM